MPDKPIKRVTKAFVLCTRSEKFEKNYVYTSSFEIFTGKQNWCSNYKCFCATFNRFIWHVLCESSAMFQGDHRLIYTLNLN